MRLWVWLVRNSRVTVKMYGKVYGLMQQENQPVSDVDKGGASGGGCPR